MPAGRPTKYNEKMVKKAKQYLQSYNLLGDQIPQVSGLALYLGINKDTVLEWSKDPKKPEFSGIYKELMTSQERDLTNRGLSGEFNSRLATLLLSSNHGVNETKKIRSEIVDLTALSDEELQKKAEDLMKKDEELRSSQAVFYDMHDEEDYEDDN